MEALAPLGSVYQAGTLSGNPVAMAAGIATLKLLRDSSVYSDLEANGEILFEGLTEAARNAGVPVFGHRVGSLMCLFFTEEEVWDWEGAKAANTDLFGRYFGGMLAEGIYLAPSQFEAMFLSHAHSEDDLDLTITAARKVLGGLASGVSSGR